MSSPTAAPARALSIVQTSFLALALVAVAGSIAWRVWAHAQDGGAIGSPPGHATSFVSGPDAAAATGTRGIERFLPYVTEAGFFGLIGFALGYATRKLFKLALLVIAVAFVTVQLLVSTGHVAVDWLGVNSLLNEWIFDLKQHESWSAFLTHRVPSAGTLLLGYVLGFRRG